MPKIDVEAVEATNKTSYPDPFGAPMGRRWYRRLAPAAGLFDFGISHVVLQPGGISSQRHWHEEVDEFLVILSGEAILVEDEGETLLRAGDCAAFPKGKGNGHQLRNDGTVECIFVAVGASHGHCHYPDIDLDWDDEAGGYRHKDGRPYT